MIQSARLISLIRKESRQLWRDKSNLAVGLLLPLALILLFGYGLSFDLPYARIAVVVDHPSPQTERVLNGLAGSPYITPTTYPDMQQAEHALRGNKSDAILRLPANFSAQANLGNAQMQLILNGASTTVAGAVQGYVNGALATMDAGRSTGLPSSGMVTVEQRMWFNEANNSSWYLVPGLLVLILTLLGAFLTALLIARERERGTLEALFVTPVRPIELVLAKLAPFLLIGVVDLALCLIAAHYLFMVPIRGSLWAVVLASLLYLLVSLAMGLTISGLTSGQFMASQVALVASFMPALMLSGFVFDLRNLPIVVQVVSQLLPATHFMSLIKTLMLGGNDWPLFLRECGILTLYAAWFINASRLSLRKRLR